MAKSTKSAPSRKRSAEVNDSRPGKPYKSYPLTLHATGRIAKKIRGKLHYFGRWGHKQGDRIAPVENVEDACRKALDEFNRQWPFLSDGKTAPAKDAPTGDGATLRDVCNAFWRSKRAKMLAGDLSARSFRDYEQTTDLLIATFGADRRVDDLRPDDFERLRSQLAERLGTHALKNTANRCRVVFKFALDNRLIPEKVSYGQSFNRPSAKAMRKARNDAGPRLFNAAELRMILDVLDRGGEIEVDGTPPERPPVSSARMSMRPSPF